MVLLPGTALGQAQHHEAFLVVLPDERHSDHPHLIEVVERDAFQAWGAAPANRGRIVG